ncbi:muscle M-line assembly protein unc-89-like [Pelmatolapia mariae]|uniref:muscle M-line assembly protein unc-89-like n=1 Tax=Pelmatolapia mariae TaxID=158779 RepID=UPI003211D3EE
MDSASSDLFEQGKQPSSSLRGVLSNFFTRDRSPSSDVECAVLVSFKELPDGETYDAEDSQSVNTENKLQGRKDSAQGDVTATGRTVQKVESPISDSDEQVKAAAEAPLDPDLVQVTRVETHSDNENEDDEVAHEAKKSTLSEEDSKKVDQEDRNASEAALQVPMFRTHKLTERSRVEAMLYSSRFAGRSISKTVQLSSISKQRTGYTLKESTPPVSESAEPLVAGDVGTGESEEYDGIDCSQPVPSIISGNQSLESPDSDVNVASPTKQTDGTQEEEPAEQTDELCSSQISSSVPSSPETHKASVPTSSPEEQSDTGFKKPLSLSFPSKKTKSDSQADAGPDAKLTKTPKTSTSSASSTSSPSRGAEISSPPSFHMPALFSGLRVLKKGGVGEDREVVSEIKQREKDSELALLNLKKSVNKAKLFPEQKTGSPMKKHTEPKSITETKSTVVGQLSHLLKLDNDDPKNSVNGQEGDSLGSKQESAEGEVVSGAKTPETPASTLERKTTSDVAYETFKNLLGPRTTKKEKTEAVDLEAVKKKIKNDKENLRSIFERTTKSPSKEVKSPKEAIVCSYTIIF